jgi:hypothetical protein
MITSTNMSLKLWDQGGDLYDHNVLASNFAAIDSHDHTGAPNGGKQLGTGALQDGAVTTEKIAPNAVTPDKIPDGSITGLELAADSVGNVHLQDDAVRTAEIQDGSVTGAKLDPNLFPYGSVIPWYRPRADVPVPGGGWEVCDGRSWSAIPNVWNQTTGSIPDLRGKFILGSGLSNLGLGVSQYPGIGQAGGSHTTDLKHSHIVNAHYHHIGAHYHGISLDGGHGHTLTTDVAGSHNHNMHSRLNALLQGIEVQSWTIPGDAPIRRQNNLQSLYVAGFNNSETDESIPSSGGHSHTGTTNSAGAHSHGGFTGSWEGNTDSDNPGTSESLVNAVDTRPGFVGLLYIMRVR